MEPNGDGPVVSKPPLETANDQTTAETTVAPSGPSEDATISLYGSADWRNTTQGAITDSQSDPLSNIDVSSDALNTPPSQTPGRGRGRGRGRGGRPRGKTSNGATHDSVNSTPNGVTASIRGTPTSGNIRGGNGRGRARGRGRGRGGRRRRSNSDEIRAEDSSSDEDFIKGESDDEGAAPTATRSGRSVQKPHAFAPTPVSGRKRKRHSLHAGGHRTKNPELSVCKVCLRPHSPASNMIVFCDGCNTPYHRYCHRPPIPQVVVDVEDKEWLCQECETDFVNEYDVKTFRPANGLTEDKVRPLWTITPNNRLTSFQIRAQLSRLPSLILTDLLIQAAALHTDIPIIPPPPEHRPAPAPPTDRPAVAAPAPPVAPNSNDNNNGLQRPPDDELESGYESDPPAHYPPPGQGLAATLPPESEHLHFLVDDNAEVYTHIVQSDARAANEAIYGPLRVGGEGEGEKMDGVESTAPDEAGKAGDVVRDEISVAVEGSIGPGDREGKGAEQDGDADHSIDDVIVVAT